jgi:hypothetical protein
MSEMSSMLCNPALPGSVRSQRAEMKERNGRSGRYHPEKLFPFQ